MSCANFKSIVNFGSGKTPRDSIIRIFIFSTPVNHSFYNSNSGLWIFLASEWYVSHNIFSGVPSTLLAFQDVFLTFCCFHFVSLFFLEVLNDWTCKHSMPYHKEDIGWPMKALRWPTPLLDFGGFWQAIWLAFSKRFLYKYVYIYIIYLFNIHIYMICIYIYIHMLLHRKINVYTIIYIQAHKRWAEHWTWSFIYQGNQIHFFSTSCLSFSHAGVPLMV